MSAYTDQAQTESYLQRELTEYEQESFDQVVEQVSDFINTYTSREWRDKDAEGDAEASQRIYDGNGQRELFVDDFGEITTLKILDSDGNVYETISSDDFIAYPLRSSTKDSIYLRKRNFPYGRATVQLTATFASDGVPVGVQMVAAELVGIFFAQGKSSSDDFKKESIEGYTYELMSGAERSDKIQSALSKLDKWRKVLL